MTAALPVALISEWRDADDDHLENGEDAVGKDYEYLIDARDDSANAVASATANVLDDLRKLAIDADACIGDTGNREGDAYQQGIRDLAAHLAGLDPMPDRLGIGNLVSATTKED